MSVPPRPQNEEPPPSEPVSHVGGAKSAATGSIRARRVSGIARLPLATTPNLGSARYLRAGQFPHCHVVPAKLNTCHRSVEKISQALEVYRGILQKLFPKVHYELLAGLSRDELLDLIAKANPYQSPSPLTPEQNNKHSVHPDAGSLEQFQPLPEDLDDGFIRPDSQRTFTGISDDVNCLSLTGRESSTYLGISSAMAALRVILWLDPDSQSFVNRATEQYAYHASPSPSYSIPDHPSSTTPTGSPKPSIYEEPSVIDAFFTYIHPSTPLLDEDTFRDTYAAATRTDSRWLLLLNAVLAVGAIASSPNSSSTTHMHYFALAREHLTIDTLNSAHVETAQALALLSGIYLHYVGEPNLANALMGATLRMATMLGLHRDFSEGLGPAKTNAQDTPRASFSIEMRRRVWWSTFMLDAWAGSTLGRPSMGRMSQAITAKHPKEPIDGSDTHLQLVKENVKFALISTRIEDSLAVSPLMDEHERQSLDNAVVQWYQSSSVRHEGPSASYSPSSATSYAAGSDAPGTIMTKNVMRWRCHLTRIILHRPALLWWAMRSRKFSSKTLSQQKRTAIDLCRSVTAELISDVISTWQTTQQPACTMPAWHASGVLYQAVMVPLLSLFSDLHDTITLHNSRQQVEATITALVEMSHWCKSAKRSLEVVSRLYEASRRHSPELRHQVLHRSSGMKSEPHDDHDLLDSTHNPVSGHPYSASSASASVSGGIGSGGLGTPATLPSTVSNHSSHLQSHQHSHLQQQQQPLQAFAPPHHHLHQQPQQTRPTFIDLPPLSTPHHHQHHQQQPSFMPTAAPPHGGAPFLTTPSSTSADLFMDTMLDSLNWSQGWSNNEYPFETPRLGWDYQAMNGWVGGVGGPDASQVPGPGLDAEDRPFEYFGGALRGGEGVGVRGSVVSVGTGVESVGGSGVGGGSEDGTGPGLGLAQPHARRPVRGEGDVMGGYYQ